MKKRIFQYGVIGLIVVAIGLSLYIRYHFYLMKKSVPVAERTETYEQLKEKVSIEVDRLGTPRIVAKDHHDALFAHGWIHARDRFFQMDLIRRRSAGRLAEIFGERALYWDQIHRRLDLLKVAQESVKLSDASKLKRFQSYVDGVNAYLSLKETPYEVQVLGYEPEPWTLVDTYLVILGLSIDLDLVLQYPFEKAMNHLATHRPKELIEFLTPVAGYFDSPLFSEPKVPELKVPGPEVFQLKEEEDYEPQGRSPFRVAGLPALSRAPDFVAGSNAFAVSGKRTKSGKPILAGDPHLGLSVPGIWYRVFIESDETKVYGASVPGIPGVVIGSNNDVAWSFTVAMVDNLDLVKVTFTQYDDQNVPTHIKMDGKEVELERERVKIKVGGDEEDLDILRTPWGPIAELEYASEDLDKDEDDVRPVGGLAVQWTALDPDRMAKIDSHPLNMARNENQFLKALEHWGSPALNAVYATKRGDIGWTIAAGLPNRVGFQGRFPGPRSEKRRWDGYVPFTKHPHVRNPKEGFVYSANHRKTPLGPQTEAIGFNFASPARARRIRDRFSISKDDWTAKDVLDVQLDSRSVFHDWYRDIIMKALASSARESASDEEKEWLEATKAAIEAWDGNCYYDSKGYAILREFRYAIIRNVLNPLWNWDEEKAEEIADDTDERLQRNPRWIFLNPEATLQALWRERPQHLLNPKFETYDEAVIAAVLETAEDLADTPEELKTLEWGYENLSKIEHPFAAALPDIAKEIIGMPRMPLSGDHWVPRVASENFGASMRLVVDLGNLEDSLFNYPGGQSGHIQSPNFRDQFVGWYHGRAWKLFPEQKRYEIQLLPLDQDRGGA